MTLFRSLDRPSKFYEFKAESGKACFSHPHSRWSTQRFTGTTTQSVLIQLVLLSCLEKSRVNRLLGYRQQTVRAAARPHLEPGPLFSV
jgi:hypothetical protein